MKINYKGDQIELVKILTPDYNPDYGPDHNVPNPKWCLSIIKAGSPMTLCTMEVYSGGEGNARYEAKVVKSYKSITCPNCREIIKEFKLLK